MGNGTSIGRVRGLGSAKHGSGHWLLQRFTAIGNFILVLWLLASLVMLPAYDYGTVHTWLAKPVSATAMVMLIVSTFYHARLGVQVLAEDYVHDEGLKFATLAALNTIPLAAGAFGVICVLRIALGGAA